MHLQLLRKGLVAVQFSICGRAGVVFGALLATDESKLQQLLAVYSCSHEQNTKVPNLSDVATTSRP